MVEQTFLFAAVALALAAAALTACGGPPEDTSSPAAVTADASASPGDVVRAYLVALQADDESAASSLTTPAYAEHDGWAEDPPTIEDVEVSAPWPEPTRGTAGEGHAQAVFVPVKFTLRGADETMPDGPTDWGYVLVRDTNTEAWRIASAGSV